RWWRCPRHGEHRVLLLQGSARISLALAEFRSSELRLFPRLPGRLAIVAQPICGKLDTALHAGRRKRQIDRPSELIRDYVTNRARAIARFLRRYNGWPPGF